MTELLEAPLNGLQDAEMRFEMLQRLPERVRNTESKVSWTTPLLLINAVVFLLCTAFVSGLSRRSIDHSDTRYINSDLVLASKNPIDSLCDEFDRTCCVLYQQQDDDGNWHASIESDTIENISAADDIQKMLAVIPQFGDDARKQWDKCYSREINIGFECGDTWAYPHSLPNNIVRAIADAECALAVTLYPRRDETEHGPRQNEAVNRSTRSRGN